MEKVKRKRIFAVAVPLVCFVLGLTLLWAARNISGVADFYVKNIYPLWVHTLGRFWGLLPFSVVEFVLYVLILIVLVNVIIGMVLVLLKKKRIVKTLIRGVSWILSLISILFFVYVLNCGINYSATTFGETYGLERRGYTQEELTQVCTRLTEQVVELSDDIDRDDNGHLKEQKEWNKTAADAMVQLGQRYDILDVHYPSPKGICVSEILSWQHISGVYSPFTVEANYNADMISYNIPFTMCHELSHLSGMMQEDEANFIGWLACTQSDNVDFNYSAALMGWIYCTNELYKVDREAYGQLYTKLPENVKKELRDNSLFWDAYEGKVSETAEKVNDTYLKAHKQTEGVMTYDRVVDLIVNYYFMKK